MMLPLLLLCPVYAIREYEHRPTPNRITTTTAAAVVVVVADNRKHVAHRRIADWLNCSSYEDSSSSVWL